MAIAFVSAADLGNNGGTSNNLTAAFTVSSGVNRALVIALLTAPAVTSYDISSVQYNSVNQSGEAVPNGSNWQTALYLGLNPTSGTNNVSITATETTFLEAFAMELSGVKQSGQPDAASWTNDSIVEATYSTTFTPVADNTWIVAFPFNGGDGVTATTIASPFTKRVSRGFEAFLATAGPIHPAAGTTITATIGVDANNLPQAQAVMSLLPFVQVVENRRVDPRQRVLKPRKKWIKKRQLLPQNIIQPAHVIPWRPRPTIWLRPRRRMPAQRLLKVRQRYSIPAPAVIPRFNQGVAFRQTLAYVFDASFFDFGQFGAMPNFPQITRQGNQVGFLTSASTVTGQNQLTTQDHRLAGNLFNNF